MMNIIIATLALGLLGTAFAALLAFFYKRFAVQVDKRIEDLSALLPGSNCGACGFPGCQGLAEAILENKAEVTGCIAGGSAIAEKVAEYMGVSLDAQTDMVAFVACRAGRDVAKMRYIYDGVDNCQAANIYFGGDKLCAYGCLGLGSCVKVCPFDAIVITKNMLAVIDPVKCKACRKCIAACPRQVIDMVPKTQDVLVGCKNLDKGRRVKDICVIGCTGCKICEKNCPEKAVVVQNNVAVMDYAKCKLHKVCLAKCPQNTFIDTTVKKLPHKAETKKITV